MLVRDFVMTVREAHAILLHEGIDNLLHLMMKRAVMALGADQKVLNSVIRLVSVDVVHHFSSDKPAPHRLFGDYYVLRTIVQRLAWLGR